MAAAVGTRSSVPSSPMYRAIKMADTPLVASIAVTTTPCLRDTCLQMLVAPACREPTWKTLIPFILPIV